MLKKFDIYIKLLQYIFRISTSQLNTANLTYMAETIYAPESVDWFFDVRIQIPITQMKDNLTNTLLVRFWLVGQSKQVNETDKMLRMANIYIYTFRLVCTLFILFALAGVLIFYIGIKGELGILIGITYMICIVTIVIFSFYTSAIVPNINTDLSVAIRMLRDIKKITRLCSKGEPIKLFASAVIQKQNLDGLSEDQKDICHVMDEAYNSNWAEHGRETLRRRAKLLSDYQLLLGAEHPSNLKERKQLKEDFYLMREFLFEGPRTTFTCLFETVP